MKKLFRITALAAVILAAAMLLTGCLMPMNSASTPSKDADDSASTVPYEQRKLVFMHASAVQVNYESPLGYFIYDDNQLRILTPDSKTGEHDDSVSYTVTVYEKGKDGSLTEASADKYTCTLRDNGYIYLKSSVIGEARVEGVCANGSTAAEVTVPIQGKGLSLFDIVIAAIGLYLIVSAILGKGRLFDQSFVREGMEKKHKTIVRVTALVVGLLMLATAAIAAFDAYDKLRIVKIVLFGVMIVLFIVSAVLMSKCMDRDKRREAQEGRYGAAGKHSPDAAFDFDDNEPTVDDIKNDPKE